MIAIIDYKVGNLYSVMNSFAAIGAEAVVTSDPAVIRAADRILLPGVGAFADAARKLWDSGMAALVREQAAAGKPVMGICLGMQLLFDKSYEHGESAGLGLIPGVVRPIRDVAPAEYKVPHVGWNALHLEDTLHPLLKYVQEGDCVYFTHSYYADCADAVIATTDYGASITAAVAMGNVCGCQFHPEKSGTVGLSVLRAFCEM